MRICQTHGKVIYSDQRVAQEAAVYMGRQKPDKRKTQSLGKIESFHAPACGGYHIGHGQGAKR